MVEEKVFDKFDLGCVFIFIVNSEVYGIMFLFIFFEIYDDIWISIKYEDENFYYGF